MAQQPYPKTLVIIPAYNEAENIARVVEVVHENAPWADIVVINDGSLDATGRAAAAAGALVLRLPYNVGIGAAVQTGLMFAARQGYEIAVRSDGDGQHAPQHLPRLVAALHDERADLVIGSRYIEKRGYQGSVPRRLGIIILATLVSLIVRQRITDPTSGFAAFTRRALQLCARVYPHDYPEPEAVVLLHRAGLRICEIPVTMNPRLAGQSSITAAHSGYYMVKVILAILVGLLRRAPIVDMEA